MAWAATGSLVVPEEPSPQDLLTAAHVIMDRFDGEPVVWHKARWRGLTQNGVGILFVVAPVNAPSPGRV